MISKFIVSACVFAMTSVTFAGPSIIGNGGNGIFMNGKLCLLDLAENATCSNPQFQPSYDHSIARKISDIFGFLNEPQVEKLLTNKLSEISYIDKVFAESVLEVFNQLKWTFVDHRLTVIPTYSLLAGEIFQMAIRSNDAVLIDRLYWNQLDNQNKVALLIHEANFILASPEEFADGSIQKSPIRSRQLTGYLFSKDFLKESAATFSARLFNYFPSQMMGIPDKPMYYYYSALLPSPAGDVTKTLFNPYLILFREDTSTTLDLHALTKEKFEERLCGDQMPDLIQLGGHTLKLELYQGQNNYQEYVKFEDVIDVNFWYIGLEAEQCKQQVHGLVKDLRKYLIGLPLFK